MKQTKVPPDGLHCTAGSGKHVKHTTCGENRPTAPEKQQLDQHNKVDAERLVRETEIERRVIRASVCGGSLQLCHKAGCARSMFRDIDSSAPPSLRDGTGWDGTGRGGMGRDGTGTGRDGTGWDAAGRDGTGGETGTARLPASPLRAPATSPLTGSTRLVGAGDEGRLRQSLHSAKLNRPLAYNTLLTKS